VEYLSYREDGCNKDSKCTEGVVLEIVAAVEVATAACVDLKGLVSLSLATKIVGIITVSLDRRPNLI